MTSASVGYSGTPLWKKLGLKPGMTVLSVNAPTDYAKLLEGMPDTARLTTRSTGECALIHLFVSRRAELERQILVLESKLGCGGSLWISWPKKSSQVATDITENTLREVLLPRGLVDVKVCAVDEVWSGLKFMRRQS